MNPAQLIGYHSEWNLVCPGGFDYQRMAQERGQLCWDRVENISGIDIELDDDQAEISRMQPWGGSQALIASDGLFSFGAALTNKK